MVCRTHKGMVQRRSGAAAAEFAAMLPFLVLLFMIGVDFCRAFYASLTLSDCARNGAIWATDPTTPQLSKYPSLQSAGVADASNLNPAPTVTSRSGTDGSGQLYVDVTATYPFKTLLAYPGFSNPIVLSKTVRMRVQPSTPNQGSSQGSQNGGNGGNSGNGGDGGNGGNDNGGKGGDGAKGGDGGNDNGGRDKGQDD
jgi:Flp pilus assembly protein TadG